MSLSGSTFADTRVGRDNSPAGADDPESLWIRASALFISETLQRIRMDRSCWHQGPPLESPRPALRRMRASHRRSLVPRGPSMTPVARQGEPTRQVQTMVGLWWGPLRRAAPPMG